MSRLSDAAANLEDFTDPRNYDLEEVEATRQRLPFYCSLARRCGGSVLDLACGSGLITVPIAAECKDVTGVDLSRHMLEHARIKASGLGVRITWLHGDIRTLRLGRLYDLILLTGNAFQALLTREDQEALLQVAREHLAASGLFVFETRNPSGHDLSLRESEEHWYSYTSTEGSLVEVTGTQSYDPVLQLMYWTTFRRWTIGSQPHVRQTRITCRFTHPQELLTLLAHNGLEVVWQHGDWEGSPVTSSSEHIISACRVAGGHS
ncbi:MAG: class I SAM-dependent methyltransferase [Rubrivivax sp.]|nr:class I SAM-dependent methyltransferase [Rubrivivax sp.]